MERQPESTIVILGDWYIDENWLISKFESYHSSAPGDIHYLTLHPNAEVRITNLCASAGLLVALKSYFSQKDISVDFLAFNLGSQQASASQLEVSGQQPSDRAVSLLDVPGFKKIERFSFGFESRRHDLQRPSSVMGEAGTQPQLAEVADSVGGLLLEHTSGFSAGIGEPQDRANPKNGGSLRRGGERRDLEDRSF